MTRWLFLFQIPSRDNSFPFHFIDFYFPNKYDCRLHDMATNDIYTCEHRTLHVISVFLSLSLPLPTFPLLLRNSISTSFSTDIYIHIQNNIIGLAGDNNEKFMKFLSRVLEKILWGLCPITLTPSLSSPASGTTWHAETSTPPIYTSFYFYLGRCFCFVPPHPLVSQEFTQPPCREG